MQPVRSIWHDLLTWIFSGRIEHGAGVYARIPVMPWSRHAGQVLCGYRNSGEPISSSNWLDMAARPTKTYQLTGNRSDDLRVLRFSRQEPMVSLTQPGLGLPPDGPDIFQKMFDPHPVTVVVSLALCMHFGQNCIGLGAIKRCKKNEARAYAWEEDRMLQTSSDEDFRRLADRMMCYSGTMQQMLRQWFESF